MPKRLNVKSDNRVMILGATGSGKTYLARKLLVGRERLVVVDPKHTFTWGAGKAYDIIVSLGELKKWKGVGSVIYRPSESDLETYCAEFWAWAWKTAPLRVYIDEVTEMTPATKPPPGLRRALKMGRERKLSVWYSSQRPSQVPISLLSEAEIIFCGLLRNPDDREKVSKFTGFPELKEMMPQYKFQYCNAIDNVTFDLNANDIVRVKK